MSEQSASPQSPWTIGRLIEWTHGHFVSKGVDTPRLAAELLLAHAMACRKIELYTRFEEVPDVEQLGTFREAIRSAVHGVPVAHILGRKEFYGIEFEVTADTLIPRPETESLVDQALAWCRGLADDTLHILDLGTGSGCIGIALCAGLPAAHVVGSDISAQALEVARGNARRLGFEARFVTIEADALELPRDSMPAGGFDAIVSNPPYIAEDDPDVQAEVREYEPHIALFAGADGLDLFRRIAQNAAACLRPGGGLFLEIGWNQHDDVVGIMTAQTQLEHVESTRDHLEGHLRVVVFRRSSP